MRGPGSRPFDETVLADALGELADAAEAPRKAELQLMARMATVRAPTAAWRRRAGRLAAAVAVAVLAAAVAVVTHVLRDEGTAPRVSAAVGPWPGAWAWSELPGQPTVVDLRVRAALARRNGVPARVREVASAETRDGRLSLLAAAGSGGRVCFVVRSAARLRAFRCVGPADAGAVVGFVGFHGGRLTLLGVARSDVTRLVVTGGERPVGLRLNRWRSFAWAPPRPVRSPLVLSAYGSGSEVLARIPLGPASLGPGCTPATPCAALSII